MAQLEDVFRRLENAADTIESSAETIEEDRKRIRELVHEENESARRRFASSAPVEDQRWWGDESRFRAVQIVLVALIVAMLWFVLNISRRLSSLQTQLAKLVDQSQSAAAKPEVAAETPLHPWAARVLTFFLDQVASSARKAKVTQEDIATDVREKMKTTTASEHATKQPKPAGNTADIAELTLEPSAGSQPDSYYLFDRSQDVINSGTETIPRTADVNQQALADLFAPVSEGMSHAASNVIREPDADEIAERYSAARAAGADSESRKLFEHEFSPQRFGCTNAQEVRSGGVAAEFGLKPNGEYLIVRLRSSSFVLCFPHWGTEYGHNSPTAKAGGLRHLFDVQAGDSAEATLRLRKPARLLEFGGRFVAREKGCIAF